MMSKEEWDRMNTLLWRLYEQGPGPWPAMQMKTVAEIIGELAKIVGVAS